MSADDAESLVRRAFLRGVSDARREAPPRGFRKIGRARKIREPERTPPPPKCVNLVASPNIPRIVPRTSPIASQNPCSTASRPVNTSPLNARSGASVSLAPRAAETTSRKDRWMSSSIRRRAARSSGFSGRNGSSWTLDSPLAYTLRSTPTRLMASTKPNPPETTPTEPTTLVGRQKISSPAARR